MPAAQITLTLTATEATASAGPVITLEQEHLPTSRLTAADLAAMLALVQSGESARRYQAASCPARVVAGQVLVDLGLYVWPSDLGLAYSLSLAPTDLVELGQPTALELPREFDLVWTFATSYDLGFLTTAASWSWQTPCYLKDGSRTSPPALALEGTQLVADAAVFGVLRFSCVARGWYWPLTVTIDKTTGAGLQSITDLAPLARASWDQNGSPATATASLALPACAESLLAACTDGTLVAEVFASVTQAQQNRPVVYFNPCDGQVLALRYEPVS